MIGREDAFERGYVISLSAAPWDAAEVEAVVYAKVGKGREVFLVDGVPEPQFCTDPAIEVKEHVEAVRALGCGCEAKKFDWIEMVEEGFVRRRRGVVKLIHDHDVEVRRVNTLNVGPIQALDRSEYVIECLRSFATDPFLAERGIA